MYLFIQMYILTFGEVLSAVKASCVWDEKMEDVIVVLLDAWIDIFIPEIWLVRMLKYTIIRIFTFCRRNINFNDKFGVCCDVLLNLVPVI